MNFTEFQLNASLMKGIENAGYTTCTPVQEQVLTTGRSGDDLYVQSQTGTGKTAAYLILMLEQMLSKPELNGKKALIMVPTRELAVQVEEEAKTLASGTNLKSFSFYGGVGYEKQKDMIKKGIDIMVGTPGRLIDLQESGALDLSDVAFLVVDEADRMFDMGFYPDLRTLIKVLPSQENRQTMLFSATLNTYVKNLAWEYTCDAKEITIEPEHITIEEIDQILIHVSSDEKTKLLIGILKNEKPESVIIFCNTKRSCEVIAKRLQMNGINAQFIIGDLPQAKRLQVLADFKSGAVTCLVATDVAARGIDVDDLAMVVNYDLPNEAENYVHRIGRTARAGKSGKAYTFCSEQDVYNLPAIERYIDKPIPASMATEDMLAQDASEGVYIKTDRYDDDEERPRGRRDGHRDGRRGESRGRGERSYGSDSRGKGRKDRNGKNDRRSERRDRSDYKTERNDAFSAELATLSFEERMKIYKEKYASKANSAAPDSAAAGANANASGTQSPKAKDGSKRSNGKKGGKNQKPKQNANSKKSDNRTENKAASAKTGANKSYKSEKPVQNAAVQAPKAAETKKGGAGILGIIQKLFGKKK